ncbi:MAG TPA: 4-hydroxy-tetrahydrodipicolinate synthase [bacterium]|uniref:4-hydroxy-tetrahydrodipicolinate synthase n=1 Tax=candidate division TA06 bacterium ADurb.Bin417 TaxID=1852828 RepID=A0A1V5MEU6_UNCT6|nr:MAG: 4-hydroxy-tetrahydrodipicolinate synthase [candidate division TA06 bacterium ADurb.Bin417]HNQ35502.1 4-hydroxy-tetrahydrodipicolinate synthase [bacterium]HNS48742.1 4-hydroxy-tetrahydrodipicolinate synthase [bacterium]
MFQGSTVALVTPFRNGRIDEKKFQDLVEWQIGAGTDALLPCGSTGESATLSMEEHQRLIELTLEVSAGRRKVIAGTGSNNTAEALHLTQHAKKVGADAALIITPYYNKPTPAGLLLHFSTIARAVDIPIILYNVPSRTGVSLTPGTVAELARIPNIVAIKEASGSLDQVSSILDRSDITVLSGDDSLTLPIMSVGGRGVISVAANVIPAGVAALTRAGLAGDLAGAQAEHRRWFPLFQALFFETNPLPVKTLLAWMGRIEPEWRPPLCPMTADNQARLRAVAEKLTLI